MWSIMVKFGQPCSTLVNIGLPWSTWPTLVNLGQLWSTLVNFGQHWPTLVNISLPWSTLDNLGLPWSTLVNLFQVKELLSAAYLNLLGNINKMSKMGLNFNIKIFWYIFRGILNLEIKKYTIKCIQWIP